MFSMVLVEGFGYFVRVSILNFASARGLAFWIDRVGAVFMAPVQRHETLAGRSTKPVMSKCV